MTNRRGFLGSMFAAAMAPAIVRAESLMKIYVPPQEILLPAMEDALYNDLSARYSHSLTKSCLLTRQQILNKLLPEMERIFGIEYDRYTEHHI
jgi:hypothetical protein